MRHLTMLLMSGTLAASLLAGCDDNNNTPTTPSTPTTPPSTPTTPPATPPSGGPSAPDTAGVSVGDIFFKSGHNGSTNRAVDTVAVGGTVTWTWTNTGNIPHSVESEGSPTFTSSAIRTGDGSTHQATFSTPGTYQYDCAVHGAAMSGTIVVQ
jgi:hypothetical protein